MNGRHLFALGALWLVAALTTHAAARVEMGAPAIASSAADSSLTPRTALMRSAVLPGWGQYSNGRPVKAALFGGGTAVLIAATWMKINDMDEVSDEIDITLRQLQLSIDRGEEETDLPQRLDELEPSHEDEAARRNSLILGIVATITFGAIDAYIDAHLVGFADEPPALEVGPTGDSLYARVIWKLD